MSVSTTVPAEHCDYCGEELGSVRHWVKADWRGEYLRVHPHCAPLVVAKNAENLTRGAEKIEQAKP